MDLPETHCDHVPHRQIFFPDQPRSIPESEGIDGNYHEVDVANANSSKDAPSYPRLLCLGQVNPIPVVNSTANQQASKPNLSMCFLNNSYTFSA